jgi:hypothetical protein
MRFLVCAEIAFWCSLIPALLFCWNLLLFRRPPLPRRPLPAVSLLIPARNEEANVAAALTAALGSEGIDFEIVVLNDSSTDRTAEIVSEYAARDPRVRLEQAPPLAAGWAGKAHAAHALAGRARHDLFCFVDADVRLSPQALACMTEFLLARKAALVSGFPQQQTVTTLEWMLLPLIHFLLLCYLPIAGLRYTRLPGFGAGCGQFLLMRRDAYDTTGGYASVRGTMHDGIVLSTLFRRDGFRTDIADLTGLACCRMYRGSAETWNGLMKNATEGLAAPARILPFTTLLLAGQVLPWGLLAWEVLTRSFTMRPASLVYAACAASLLPRLVAIPRFQQRVISAAVHPLAIVVLLCLQWQALVRKLFGIQVSWKERAFRVG